MSGMHFTHGEHLSIGGSTRCCLEDCVLVMQMERPAENKAKQRREADAGPIMVPNSSF